MNLGTNPETRNQRWILLGVVGFYIAVLAAMSLMGRYGFIYKTVIVPLLFLAALASRRGAQFVRDWAIFLSLVVLFDYIRGFIFALITYYELPVYMNYAIDLELLVGGGQIVPVVFQNLLRGSPISPVLDRFFVVVHSSHFLVFLFLGLIVWLLRPDGFNKYKLSMLTLMYLGALAYFFIPTVPPWMASADFGAIAPVDHTAAAIYNASIPTLQKALDVNPIAAMPSLHAAFPTLCCLIAVYHFRRRALPMILYALLIFLAIIYLGEHYLVDVIAGVFLGVAVSGFVYRYLATREGHHGRLAGIGHWLRKPGAPTSRALSPVLALSMLIVFLATGVGALTVEIRGPVWVGPDFVERELKNAGAVADSFLETYAYHRSRFKNEVEEASYLLSSGNAEGSVALFKNLVDRSPQDPEPLYWLTYFQFRAGRIDEQHVLRVIQSLGALPDERTELYRRLLKRIVDS